MRRDRGLPPIVGHGGRNAVVVADLQAIRTPHHDEITLRRHLLDPSRRDPRPGATRIHEHLDLGHATRVRRGGTSYTPLVELARALGGRDNVAVVVARIS